jgi:hypothetical protein
VSPERSAYLTILDEIKRDLPWLIQVWLKLRSTSGGQVESIDVKAPRKRRKRPSKVPPCEGGTVGSEDHVK